MAFQEPRLLPWRSVEDNVRLAAPEASEAEVAALFAALGLSEHRTHFPGELSVGLARRVALARAFAVRPTLLLLDEPFVSLDAPLARQLQRDLARLVESRSMITVLVTHDVDEAIALADRIFVLSARPAHVVGEIRVASPRVAMSGEEGQSGRGADRGPARAEVPPGAQPALLDRLEHLEGGGVLGGVVDAENGGAARERCEIGGQRADQAARRRSGRVDRLAGACATRRSGSAGRRPREARRSARAP